MIDIEEYYNKYGPLVYKRCLFLLKERDDALDAMQNVFAKLIAKETLDVRFPSTYLFRSATNECLNLIRSRKKINNTNIDPTLMTIASDEDLEKRAIVRETVEELFSGEKASTRTIAVMYHIDKMSLADIAEEMNLSVSGIKKRLKRIKDKIAIKEEYYAR